MRLMGNEGSPPFIKEVKKISEHATIIKLSGAVDMNTVPSAENILKENQKYLSQNVVLDFKEVTHIDTSTLAVLIYAINRLKQSHKKLYVINVNNIVREHIRILKLESLINVCDTLEEAVREINVET